MLKKILYIFVAVILCQEMALADGLKVFGFFQGRLAASDVETNIPGFPKRNSFDIQQLNLMAANDFGSGFSAFVNLEFVNTYNTKEQWGSLGIQEAFARYTNEDGTFQVKAGLFLPQFNNLMEISNRTPLLPYIYRPLAYESQLSNVVNLQDYLPQSGNFQVYGVLPAFGDVKAEYALYTGNMTNDFIDKTDPANGRMGANNTITALTYGGRVGLKANSNDYGAFKVGVSYVLDKQQSRTYYKFDNMLAGVFQGMGLSQDSVVTGRLDRHKLGADLSYSIAGFTLTGEVVSVGFADQAELEGKLKGLSSKLEKEGNTITDAMPDGEQKTSLQQLFKKGRGVGDKMDRLFYYTTLNYDVTDDLFAYVGVSSLIDKVTTSINDGVNTEYIGGGYRFTPNTILKFQYIHFDIDAALYSYKENMFQVAVSVMF